MAQDEFPGAAPESPPVPADALRDRIVSAVPVAAGAADVAIYSRECLLVGWSLRETAGAAASLQLLTGTDTKGILRASIGLAAAGSDHEAITPGVHCPSGLFLHRLAGSCEGCIYIKR